MGLIAIGDVHGCARTLEALLQQLDIQTDDHLVFVGDYIDRGPDSRAVIDILIDLRQRTRCTFLRGNHEAMLLAYLDHGEFDLWRSNGGMHTLASYGAADGSGIPDEHVEFIRKTELFFETPDFLIVHAGLRPEYTVERNLQLANEDVFLWERGHLDAPRLNWEKTVVCGHTPVHEPRNAERLINIDTGCVFHMRPGYGRLTAVRLPERRFVSVPYCG